MAEPKWGFKTTAEEVAKGLDLTGKIIIVTGANNGLGKETARVLALHHAHVIIAVRNVPSGEEAAKEIIASTGNKNVEVVQLDLASLASVRAFASGFLARNLPLHCLINNAGVMALKEYSKTQDGFESQFGCNHVGHFLLTNLLLSALKAGAPSRVVNVSSIGHRISGIMWPDPNKQEPYDKWKSYGQSKTANILFAIEFNARHAAEGIEAFSLHPGGIMTGLQKELTKEEMNALGWFTPEGKLNDKFKNMEQGAATTIYAATASELKGKGGAYLDDCQISQVERPESADPEIARKLWTFTEELVGQKF